MQQIMYLLIFLSCVGLIMLLLSIPLYAWNRKKYYTILKKYNNSKLDTPAIYLFYSNLGFFGAYLTFRFFINLNDDRKILYLSTNSNAYLFFKKNAFSIQWMRYFCFIWKTGTLLVFIPGLIILALDNYINI